MSLTLLDKSLPEASPDILEKIAIVEARMRQRESTFHADLEHSLHAGMYARTCRVAAKMAFSSVLIKIPTLVIVHGHCVVLAGSEWREIHGYNVIEAVANRKQVYVTLEATEITMIFKSEAKTVIEAEAEFTDDTLWRAECQA